MSTHTVRFRAEGRTWLDGRLREPDGSVARAAILCHPHPAFGGSMDVWLLPRIGERIAEDGWASLRFNFRGVPARRACPDGRDERVDLRAAIGFVSDRYRGLEQLALIGWSFGATVALHAGMRHAAVTDWVGIAPPTRVLDELPMPGVPSGVEDWRVRRVAIVGEHDQFFPPEGAAVLAPHTVHVLAGADHFLFDRDNEVAELVARSLSAP